MEKSIQTFCDKIQCEHLTQRVIHIIHASQSAYPNIKRTLLSLHCFISEVQQKWRTVQRNHKRFLNANKKWLDSEIRIKFNNVSTILVSATPVPGRPKVTFSKSSERSKRRKMASLRQNDESNELLYAAQMNLRSVGKVNAANIIKNININSGNYKKNDFTIPKLSVEKTLSMIIEAGLSTNQYEIIRAVTKEISCDIFPSYEKLKEEKMRCYPNIITIEIKAEVKLQDILNHIAERIILSQKEVLEQHNLINKELCLISKWGCDGSTGHTMHKQKFENFENSDQNMFLTSFVPLQLITKDDKKIIWQNP